MIEFTDDELRRYSRQILLRDVGIEGQDRIRSGKVLIVGAGGLGSPAALYLAAAGVGTIGVADGDRVDLSNLQRQIAHTTADVGREKALSAKEKLERLNPAVKVVAYTEFLTADNAMEIVSGYDFVIEASDNFPTKFLVNDACVMAGKPFSTGGILRFQGQTLTCVPGVSACYRCLFPQPPADGGGPTCSQAGVLGPVAGVVGCLQATEALKHLAGAGRTLTGRLLMVDALTMDFSTVEVRRAECCPVCGARPSITELREYEQKPCGASPKNQRQNGTSH